jgi:Phage protein Gp19/Gp15/Gp42
MAVLATWEDVQSRLLGRTLTVPEQETIMVWIGDLESDIRRRIPDVDAQIDADPNFGNTIKRVISAVVKRVLDNPKGLRQSTVSIDDYSRTETVDTTGSSGVLGFSVDDWEALLPITSGDAWTITPYGAQ